MPWVRCAFGNISEDLLHNFMPWRCKCGHLILYTFLHLMWNFYLVYIKIYTYNEIKSSVKNRCIKLNEYHFKAICTLFFAKYVFFVVMSLPQKLWSRNLFDKFQVRYGPQRWRRTEEEIIWTMRKCHQLPSLKHYAVQELECSK